VPLIPAPLQTVHISAPALPDGFGWLWVVSAVGNPIQVYINGFSYVHESAEFLLPDGTYQLNATLPGFVPVGEQFTVNGTTTVTITFVPLPAVATFHEVGLPAGTQWVVEFNGIIQTTTSAWVNYSVLSGAYEYGVTSLTPGWVATPSGGTALIGGNTTVEIVFAPYSPAYSVYFTVSGVPAGTSWSLTFDGTLYTTTNSTLVIPGVSPGTYAWNVTAPAGYNATPSSGSITVTSSSVSRGIAFSMFTYTVTFVETGLPNGTAWAVSLNGVIFGSTTDSISFQVAPGTYDFLVGFITGWSPSPSSGTVVVTGPMTEDITFSAI